MTASAPTPLADFHDLDGFDCGVASLDDWLKRRARANQAAGASRTFVSTDGRVVAYYSLASGSIALTEATGAFRRNMPDPIPVVILGRLAVCRSHQGRRLGAALLRDAGQRVANAGEAIGIRGLVVHAVNEAARDFYFALGFQPSPIQPMMVMMTLSKLRESLS